MSSFFVSIVWKYSGNYFLVSFIGNLLRGFLVCFVGILVGGIYGRNELGIIWFLFFREFVSILVRGFFVFCV